MDIELLKFLYLKKEEGYDLIRYINLPEKYKEAGEVSTQKMLHALEGRDYIKLKFIGQSRSIYSLGITRNGIFYLDEASKGNLYKWSKRIGDRKNSLQLIRNVMLTLVVIILLVLYYKQGVKIESMYDIIDSLK